MKKLVSNIFALTGMILVALALIHLLMQHTWMYIPTVLQIFVASAIIQVGLHFLDNIELRYSFANTLLHLSLIPI